MKESGRFTDVVSINNPVTTEGLLKIHVQPLPKEYAPAGKTAKHEAAHAVTAIATGTGVEMATIVPGTGYLGLTKLTGFNALAAAAPHGMGMGGTGHDMMIVSLMGHRPDSAARAAKKVAEANSVEIAAVAGALERHKTLSGSEIHEVFTAARKPTHANVQVETPDGDKITLEKQEVTSEGTVHVVFDRHKLLGKKEKPITTQDEVPLAA